MITYNDEEWLNRFNVHLQEGLGKRYNMKARVLCWTDAALSRIKPLVVKQRSLMSSERLGSPKATFFLIFLDELFNNLLKIVVHKKQS